MRHPTVDLTCLAIAMAMLLAPAFCPQNSADYLELEGKITGLIGITPDGLENLNVDDAVQLKVGIPAGPSDVVQETPWMRAYRWPQASPPEGLSLQRLQDLQVTIEVRFITLNDNFFERIGVDFDFALDDNVTVSVHNNDPAIGGLDAVSFAFDASGLLGTTPLNVQTAVTVYDTNTQWLNNSNILQAPKVTLFNGQQATVSDTTLRPFVISITPVVGIQGPGEQRASLAGPWTLTGEITRLTVVPEPSTSAASLVALSFGVLGFGRRRHRSRR